MKNKNLEPFAREFEKLHPSYRGWNFEYAYPGVFQYTRESLFAPDDEWFDLFFTPDWNEEGKINAYFANESGGIFSTPSGELNYSGALSIEALAKFAYGLIDQFEMGRWGSGKPGVIDNV